MRKTLLVMAGILTAAAVYGQNGKRYFGAAVGYRGDVPAAGINIRYGQGIIGGLVLEPNFNYFFNESYTHWDINLDIHYKIRLGERFRVYPIAGISYNYNEGGVDVDLPEGHYDNKTYKESYKDWGASFGAGASFDLTRRFFVNVDARYRGVKHTRHGLFGAGLGYRF